MPVATKERKPKVPAKARAKARTVDLGKRQPPPTNLEFRVSSGRGAVVIRPAVTEAGLFVAAGYVEWNDACPPDLPACLLLGNDGEEHPTMAAAVEAAVNTIGKDMDCWLKERQSDQACWKEYGLVDDLRVALGEWDFLEAIGTEETVWIATPPVKGGRTAEPVPTLADKFRDPSPNTPDVIDIPLNLDLFQHPDNPDPTEAEIVQMMEWLEADGRQEEPITVRPIFGGRYQVLAGKRRCLAARRLGWQSLRAVVRNDLAGDDRGAMLLMVRSNAHRHEDTPIRQAIMLETMLAAGMTREEAGREFGLKTTGAVDNKLGLLTLPEVWQTRIISGEIPQSAAVALLPYARFPTIIDSFEKLWQDTWRREEFLDKETQRDAIVSQVLHSTRPVDRDAKYDGRLNGNVYYDPKKCHKPGSYGLEFKLTPELESDLQIEKLPIGINGAKIRRALNCWLFDEMNIAAIEAKGKKAVKKLAAQTDRGAAKEKPVAKTAAQLKQEAKVRAEQLDRLRLQWVHRWLRPLVASGIQSSIEGMTAPAAAERIYDWWAIERPRHDALTGDSVAAAEMWERAISLAGCGFALPKKKASVWDRQPAWNSLKQLDSAQLHQVRLHVALLLIAASNRDERYPMVPLQILIESADQYGIDWHSAWTNGAAVWLADWLAIHRAPELLDQAREWQGGIHLDEKWTATKMRTVIVAAWSDRKFPLPKCLDSVRANHLKDK